MQPTDIAWLAGLLEGEGWFYVDMRARAKGRHRPTLRAGVEMVDEDVVRRAADLMGTNVYSKPPRKDKNAQRTYITVANGQKAAALMQLVQPYMGQRRSARIKELLAMSGMSHHPSDRKAKVQL